MTDIPMTSNDYKALDHARDHCLRSLSAVRAADLPDRDARNALAVAHSQLSDVLRTLEAIKQRARVSP